VEGGMSGGRLSKKQKASRVLGGYTWFPFDVIDWLTSPDVARMTAAERGVYITLLAVQWRDGHVSSDVNLAAKSSGFRSDLLTRWFANWAYLFPESVGNPAYLRNEKLHEIALEVAKSDPGRHAEEKRIQEIREEDTQVSKEVKKEEAPVASLPSPESLTPKILGDEPEQDQNQKQPQPLSEPTPETDALNDIWMSATGKHFEEDSEAGWSDAVEANQLIADHGFDEVAAVLQNTLTERPKSSGLEWTDFRVFARNYDLNLRKWKAWMRTKKARASAATAGKPRYRQESGKQGYLEKGDL
jgi:hypothetical protein